MTQVGLHHRCKGIAILTVLLILSMLTVVMSSLISDEHIMIRRGSNLRVQQQLRELALGGEQWARLILYRDIKKSKTDYLQEKWHQPLSPATIEQGKLTAVVNDMQARFNLNNLSAGRDPIWYPAYRRLLRVLDLNETLADSLVDWIDQDQKVTGPGGAEDLLYLSRKPPHRAANRLLADTGELLQIAGYNRKIVHKLAPYVTTLPFSGVKININTCDPLLLRIVGQRILDEDSAKSLVEGRGENGYKSIGIVSSMPVFAGQGNQLNQSITVSSQYFEVSSTAELSGVVYRLISWIQRKQVTSVMRRYRSLL